MKLKELLNLITDENICVSVYTDDFTFYLESYDGRDSLSHDYDECSVEGINTGAYLPDIPGISGVICIEQMYDC